MAAMPGVSHHTTQDSSKHSDLSSAAVNRDRNCSASPSRTDNENRIYGERPREFQSEFQPDPDDRAGNEEYPFYKTLRETSRLFCQIATPFLFEVLVLYRHFGSWASLNNVAGSRLAPCVKTILLATVPAIESYDTEDEWRVATASMRGARGLLRTQPPDGGPYARLDFGKVDECYSRYEYWRDGEQTMKRHLERGIAPELRLHLLTNLERVQIVNHWGLASIRVRVNKENYGHWDAQDLTRREVESCVRDDESRGFDDDSHMKLLSIVYEASGGPAFCLALGNPWELTYKGPNSALRFTALRRLELNMLSTSDSHLAFMLPFREPGRFPLSPWVLSLDALEELSVIGSTDPGRYDIFHLLALVSFPNLSRISLQGATMSHATLARFLDKHWPNLSYLRIQDPAMMIEGEERYERAKKQREWDQARRSIQAAAEENGVRTELSDEVLSPMALRLDSRYKRYLAF